MKRIDERDTMFARMAQVPGSWQYTDYYESHPEHLSGDEEIRRLPSIGGEGTATYHEINGPIADANFLILQDIRHLAEGPVNPVQTEVSPEEMSVKLKELTKYYGAVLSATTVMNPDHFYRHRGRHPEVFGQEVNPEVHPYGLVYAVEMDRDMLSHSPLLPEVITTSHGYVQAAVIGLQVAYYLRQLGYEARVHLDANYLAVLPLVAQAAGLGEIGRMGILTTKDYGSRIRLGLVTTNLPLISNQPISFGLDGLCERCGICATNCPAKAIPKNKQLVEGTIRWQIVQEKCYRFWRHVGTDCGICINSCPLSQELLIASFTSDEDIDAFVNRHKEKYGKRPFNPIVPSWLESKK